MTPPPPGLANAAGSLRREMAAASSICQIGPTRCQARTRLYRDGKLEAQRLPPAGGPTEYVPAKREQAWQRMRPVLDARPDLARAAQKYAVRRSPVARMGIAVLCWADA
jgi:hypothetical protein